MQKVICFSSTLMILIGLTSADASVSCENLYAPLLQQTYSKDFYPWYSYMHSCYDCWYNTTFWGGYELIYWQDNIGAPHCRNSYTADRFLVLSEKHPETADLTDAVHVLQGCIVSQTGVCEENVTVDVIKCDDDILYRFPLYSYVYSWWDVYICFDRIYTQSCDLPALPLPANAVSNSASLVKLKWSEIRLGWYNSSIAGIFYTIPLLNEFDTVVSRCYENNGIGLYRQVTGTVKFGANPTGLRICQLIVHEYELYYDETDVSNYGYNCGYHVFVRSCKGVLMLDLSLLAFLEEDVCLIRTDNVKVLPEIRHSIRKIYDKEATYNQYIPSLQYRCSFQVTETYVCKVNWYINGVNLTSKGPTRQINELVLNETDLSNRALGYEVKCGVQFIRNETDQEPHEVYSDDFYAGYRFSDASPKISKIGYTFFSVRKTVPSGCAYDDQSSTICEERLTFVDTSKGRDKIIDRSKRNLGTQRGTCSEGVVFVNADDPSTPYQMVKTQRAGENWTGPQRYNFRIATIDATYQDSDQRSARVQQNNQLTTSDNPECYVQMYFEKMEYNKDKLCYSHVDPHMRTADGKYYEQQREGDYMLYKHLQAGIEVQERTKKCIHTTHSNAVCACGVIVRAGRDVFTINRCQKPFKIQFERCGDCGNLDVVKINDMDY